MKPWAGEYCVACEAFARRGHGERCHARRVRQARARRAWLTVAVGVALLVLVAWPLGGVLP